MICLTDIPLQGLSLLGKLATIFYKKQIGIWEFEWEVFFDISPLRFPMI